MKHLICADLIEVYFDHKIHQERQDCGIEATKLTIKCHIGHDVVSVFLFSVI